jgi:hypothetical protein
MRALRWLTPLWLVPLLASAGVHGSDLSGSSPQPAPGKTPPAAQEGSCGRFGTQVEFVDTPSEAAGRAAKEEKLVFVLHVSGNFEDPRFT